MTSPQSTWGVSLGQLTQSNMPDNPEIWKAAAMADHFEKIQKLPDPVVGCPNFRRIPGYKVYCCGQPTAEGFKNCLEKVCGTIYPKDGKIIWLNMRQEPNVYVNGTPICARPPNKIGENAELGAVTTAALNADEPEFMRVVEGRMKENADKLKYVDISKKEHEVEVKDLKTLENVIEGLKESFPGLVHLRVPVCNSAAPSIADFDTICENLVGTGINTPIIINDQVGLSRATTACVIACLFKEFQINASFEGLVETVPGVNLDLLKMDRYTMDAGKDPLFRGEFEVVKELVATLKDGVVAKNECDKDRQEWNSQDRRHWHQAAEGEHCRVQAFLRDHGRCRPGFPQDEDHGQHPQVLLPYRLYRLHEGGSRSSKEQYPRGEEGRADPHWWQVRHPRQPAEAGSQVRRLHGGQQEPDRPVRDWQGQPAVGEGHPSCGPQQPREPGQG